ncbi:hypothetical protein BDB00DRAFT_788691 [Zychaea mexicana]|uniref:uncharacterized protein n=1 Tax=Zychaea mexicana TaxID=64656 RepID=UPI0022FDD9F1|nr:uncharacterized protein BDB00DRAFT_788691 [Zychaea mexicana]KAI9492554.1 hypothetical protein BDB00DRAFT_788691 [Zychaea mexicana]
MSKESASASFPLYTLDVKRTLNSFEKIGPAIDNRDYDRALKFASITIDCIQKDQLIKALDHRAYVLGKKARFGEAVQDAQRIISLASTWAMGYCRLGNLYAQQGKQLDAIDTYSIGLQSVSQDASLYAQLIEGKHSAELQNEKRVDFIRSLPVEVMAKIITLLPRDAKLVCLQVSSIWCKRTLEFSGSWRVSSGDDMTDEQSIKVVTYIAAYVEQLTIDTSNQQVWNQLLVDMQGGHFRKITSLHLTETYKF